MKFLCCAWLAFAATRAAAYNNGAPHSRMPPLGWGSWNALGPRWNTERGGPPQHDYCDEGSVKATMDAFHTLGFYSHGYRHFHLDDCWSAEERNASGFLQANRLLFPKGMADLVEYAHARNLTFGLVGFLGFLAALFAILFVYNAVP